MRVICPLCSGSNPIVDGYARGAVLACTCGAFLEFVGPDKPPNVVEKVGIVSRAQEPEQIRTQKPG